MLPRRNRKSRKLHLLQKPAVDQGDGLLQEARVAVKKDIMARIAAIEYDPNRSANIALLHYTDGEKKYILAPQELKIGDQVFAGEKAEIKPGNALPLGKMPIGTVVHNIELIPGAGGQIVRSAGAGAIVAAKEGKWVHLKLPSKEIR